MALRKTVIFLPPAVLAAYDKLARRVGVSRSEALRLAAETALGSVREILGARLAHARPAPSAPVVARATRADAVVQRLRDAAALIVRVQPSADAAVVRDLLLEELAKTDDDVPPNVIDEIVRECVDVESPGLSPLPGDQPPQ
ncbi:MAG: ribbon-helix-helix domain-containing protein [Acidobacteria bacterium]|nr:ribbon-helix-helix domain-containing protein [Acidobacteriota bacterium]